MVVGLFRRKKEVPIRSPRITDQNESLTFRRSRTLTGSASEDVRTVSENRAQLRSPRLKEHELRTHRRRLGGYLVIVLVAIGLLLLLLSQFIGIIRLNTVSSSPLSKKIDEQMYLGVIDAYFASHPIERFRFALDEDSLARYMEEKAPEVASLNFENTGLVTADADIRFREPVVAWQLQAVRSYVDGAGMAFTRNYYLEPSVTVKDDSGIDPSSGAIVSDRFLQFMGRVIALSNASGTVKITGATIPRNTTREIDFNLEGRGYTLKTQLGRDPASQAADIVNAVKYIDSKSLQPSYIDVRISGKAAFR